MTILSFCKTLQRCTEEIIRPFFSLLFFFRCLKHLTSLPLCHWMYHFVIRLGVLSPCISVHHMERWHSLLAPLVLTVPSSGWAPVKGSAPMWHSAIEFPVWLSDFPLPTQPNCFGVPSAQLFSQVIFFLLSQDLVIDSYARQRTPSRRGIPWLMKEIRTCYWMKGKGARKAWRSEIFPDKSWNQPAFSSCTDLQGQEERFPCEPLF